MLVIWNERARPLRARARRGERGDVLAGEADAARVRAQVAGELADERRLAGAVRADDRVRLALARRRSRRRRSRAARRTTCDRPATSSRASLIAVASRQQAGEPAPANSTDQHEDRPEDDLPVRGPAPRAGPRAAAARAAPSTGPPACAMPPRITMNMISPERVQFMKLGREVGGVVDEQRAGQAAHRAGDDERGEPVAVGREADGARARLVRLRARGSPCRSASSTSRCAR